MMNDVKIKLRSEKGASLSFALLLFLVCLVVGSVVLTAGTAAAGRFSRAAKLDAQYYSVTSAASLIQDMVEKEPVKVTNVKVTETKKNYTTSAGAPGGETSDPETTVTESASINGTSTEENRKLSMLEDAASRLTSDDGGAPLDGESLVSRAFTLTVREGTSDIDSLEVTIDEKLSPDGTLVLDLSGGDDQTGYYTIRMTFLPDMQQVTDTQTVTGTPENVTATSYTITTTVTETTTTTISWKLSSIRTLKEAAG